MPRRIFDFSLGYALGSGLAQSFPGQRPEPGAQPHIKFFSLTAGQSPASHRAAKPEPETQK